MIWDAIGNILKPVGDIVDNVVTTKEEAGQLKNEMRQIINQAQAAALEYDKKLLDSRTQIVKAEAQGQSWLQRNWRPILMLSIVAIVVNNYLIYPYLSLFWEGAQVLDLPGGLWALMTTGVGGYIVGRSGEKIADNLKK